MRGLVIAFVVLGGCWHETHQTETLRSVIVSGRADTGGFDGAEVSGGGGWSGIQLVAMAHLQQLTRAMDPNRHLAGGLDLALRASLFGVVANDHRIDHWFDVGAFGGVGGGLFEPAGAIDGYGQLWGGAWTQIGITPGRKYWAVFLDVRRVAYRGSQLDDATVFGIGLGFVERNPGYPDIHD